MKFIHIADLHLGAEPDAGRAYSQNRSQELWETLQSVLEVCEEEQTDLLLIAGDIFHGQPLRRELKELNYYFAELTHTKVVLIAGNHDYIRKDSYYRTFQWNENVIPLFGRELEYVEFPELRTAVYGLSYYSREIREPLYESAFAGGIQEYEILLAHGGDEKHCPFRVKKLEESGFDYIALDDLLERIKDKPNEFLEDKYYIIHSAVYSSLGRYKEAYEMFRKYYANLDSIHSDIFDHDTLFVEKKHALEMAELKAEKRKEMIIWISVCSLLAAASLILFLYYRGRLMKSKRAVAEKENARLIMEQEALKTEKRNIELEKDKKELEAADLRREVAQLENERDYLEDSLQRSNDGHVALRAVAEKRLEMLNGLLASKITNNETYAGSYNEMIAKIKDDRNAFLESLRSMIKTNYPKFMDFLVGKGLNDKEISYICLYALGLSGKEIGEYINLKRHYAFSSAIRKKLNIDGDAGNLGPYIRRLMDE